MQLIRAKNHVDDYISFIKHLYKNNPYYKGPPPGDLKNALRGQGVFWNSLEIIPVMITDREKIVAVATFIITGRLENTLQIGFFEAMEGFGEAVDLLLKAAGTECRERGLKRITVGLNGHINYCLGILADHFDKPPSFGSPYNPWYYADYFSRHADVEHLLNTYALNWKEMSFDSERAAIDRNSREFVLRAADFSSLKKETRIYNYLNNRCFADHPFYFERTVEEDYEQLLQFKSLTGGEGLLIAEKEGSPAGYILWHPDYSQPPSREDRINKFKLAEMAVLPCHFGSGLVMALLDHLLEMTRDRFDYGESGWILAKNGRCDRLTKKWADYEYRHYKLFEISAEE